MSEWVKPRQTNDEINWQSHTYSCKWLGITASNSQVVMKRHENEMDPQWRYVPGTT